MNGIKKDRWTEAEVLTLPSGEHDYFDRKSGALLADPNLRKDLAKALSAFANSGGGHLVLGVRDDGTFDGVRQVYKGRIKTRDWIEQIIPDLLSYTLEDFRVHEVEPATPSAIPAGNVVIVIDVGDSVLAPHQSSVDMNYYYRAGGRSLPAPHFYLETLRNRLVGPSLKSMLESLELITAYRHEDGVFVETELKFRITNTGRAAAYKWALVIEGCAGEDINVRVEDYKWKFSDFPQGSRGRSGGIPIDDTILPSLSKVEERDFGFFLRPASIDKTAISADLSILLPSNFRIQYRAISEISRGESVETELSAVFDLAELVDKICALVEPAPA